MASDFQQKMHRIGRTSYAWSDAHIMLTSAAVLESADVAVGISHTGSTVETIDALSVARRRGATTVALTNFPRSPIADAADLVLTTAATRDDVPLRRDGEPAGPAHRDRLRVRRHRPAYVPADPRAIWRPPSRRSASGACAPSGGAGEREHAPGGAERRTHRGAQPPHDRHRRAAHDRRAPPHQRRGRAWCRRGGASASRRSRPGGRPRGRGAARRRPRALLRRRHVRAAGRPGRRRAAARRTASSPDVVVAHHAGGSGAISQRRSRTSRTTHVRGARDACGRAARRRRRRGHRERPHPVRRWAALRAAAGGRRAHGADQLQPGGGGRCGRRRAHRRRHRAGGGDRVRRG